MHQHVTWHKLPETGAKRVESGVVGLRGCDCMGFGLSQFAELILIIAKLTRKTADLRVCGECVKIVIMA